MKSAIDYSYDSIPQSVLKYLAEALPGIEFCKDRFTRRANDFIREFQRVKFVGGADEILFKNIPVNVLSDLLKIVPLRELDGTPLDKSRYAIVANAIHTGKYYPMSKSYDRSFSIMRLKQKNNKDRPYCAGSIVSVFSDSVSHVNNGMLMISKRYVGPEIPVFHDPPPSLLETIIVLYDMIEDGEFFRTSDGYVTNVQPKENNKYQNRHSSLSKLAGFPSPKNEHMINRHYVSDFYNYLAVHNPTKHPIGEYDKNAPLTADIRIPKHVVEPCEDYMYEEDDDDIQDDAFQNNHDKYCMTESQHIRRALGNIN